MSDELEPDKLKSFFWNNPNWEPKRAFRWRLLFDDIIQHIPEHYVVKAEKPSLEFKTREVIGLGTKEKVADLGNTRPITITLIDDEYNTVVNWIYYYYKVSGLEFSKSNYIHNQGGRLKIDTEKAKKKTNNIQIQMLSSDGVPIEIWELYGAYISKFEQSALEYELDGLATYTITIEYDMFEYRINSKDKGFGSKIEEYAQKDTETPVKILDNLEKVHGKAVSSKLSRSRKLLGRLPEDEKA